MTLHVHGRRGLLTGAAAVVASAALLPASASAATTTNRPAGVVPPTKPFAALPFARSMADTVKLTNTWETATNEVGIVGEGHEALDFEAPYGTPVLAMHDGWAVASYQSYIVRGGTAPFDPANPSNPETDWRDPYTGREGYLAGAGLFVELQMDKKVPGSSQNYVAQLFHLSAFEPDNVAWLPPTRWADTPTHDGKLFVNWYPALIPQSQAAIRQVAKRVKRGDVLGYTGDTGIGFGWCDELDPETGMVTPRDREEQPPWDPQGAGQEVPIEDASMVHAQFYGGRNASNTKIFTLDGLDLYSQVDGMGIALEDMETGSKPLFKRSGRGRLLFADEC